MSSPKLGFEESVEANVVLKELCSGCGACVISCPFSCLEYSEEKPKLVKKCEICGICSKVCPRLEFSQEALETLTFGKAHGLGDEFGAFRRLVVAQATDDTIRRVCQDGGVVSAILTYAFDNGVIDSAIVSDVSEEKLWFAVPRLISSSKDVLQCAGTRYTYSPSLFALTDAVQRKKRSLAFVGTPCQIQSLRKIEALQLKKYSIVKFTIGLMCTECFDYNGLMKKHIEGVLGFNLSDVEKVNIKGKVVVSTRSGQTKTTSLKEAKQYTRKGCLPCMDFSAELADISVGGLGLNGWTFTILRSKMGEGIFDRAEKAGAIQTRSVKEEKLASDLLLKLSTRKKRKQAQST
jgi:coenzyme F420 hydrogenase subunit beta